MKQGFLSYSDKIRKEIKHLAKARAAGSNPVSRWKENPMRMGFFCYNENVAAPQSGDRKGVGLVLTGFLISVAASIIAYYVCKWLDERFGGK